MKKNKALFVTLTLLLTATCAMAEWKETGNKDDDLVKEYWDPATIQKKDGNFSVQRLRNYRTVQAFNEVKYLSMKTLQEFDCRASKFRLNASFYDGNMAEGKVVYTSTTPTNWESPASGTINAALISTLCK